MKKTLTEGTLTDASKDHFYRDIQGSSASERDILERLAADVMGYYVFKRSEQVNAEEIEAHAPCVLHDGPEDLAVFLLYDYIEQADIIQEQYTDERVTERALYGRFWNPLNEIHDAWDVLEAFQKRGTPLLLEPAVFGVPGPMAARVICMTALDALEKQRKVLV